MRREFSKKTTLAAWLRCNGKCEECGNPIRTGNGPHYHHILEATLGGEPTLANCKVLCIRPCHSAITSGRSGELSKTRRIEEKRMGLRKSSRPMRHPYLRKKMNGEVVAR